MLRRHTEVFLFHRYHTMLHVTDFPEVISDSYLSHSLKSLGFTLFCELEIFGFEAWSNENKSYMRVDES